jgi:hypothetical protein
METPMEGLRKYVVEAIAVIWLAVIAFQYVTRYLILSPTQAEQLPDIALLYITMLVIIAGVILYRTASYLLRKK